MKISRKFAWPLSLLGFVFAIWAGRFYYLNQPPSEATAAVVRLLDEHPEEWTLREPHLTLENSSRGITIIQYGERTHLQVRFNGTLVEGLARRDQIFLTPNQNHVHRAVERWEESRPGRTEWRWHDPAKVVKGADVVAAAR